MRILYLAIGTTTRTTPASLSRAEDVFSGWRPIIATAIVLFAVIASSTTLVGQVTDPPTVYNTIPNGLLKIPPTLPGNVSSISFEGAAIREFGDGLNLAPGGRVLTTVMVVMSSWACQSGAWNTGDCVTGPGSYVVGPGLTVATFAQPITLNIYASNGASPPEPGAKIASLTLTFNIPYRPSANAACTGMAAGDWLNSADGICYTGLANKITFDFKGQNIFLPDQIMVGVTFNTTSAGYNPIGPSACSGTPQGCPYDSLNVSADTTAQTATVGGGIVFIGTPIDPNGIYVNYIMPGSGCGPPSPASMGNAFLLDTPCWGVATGGPYHPEIMVNTVPGAMLDGAYLTKVFPNLGAGDSVINIGNTGASSLGNGPFGAITGGNLCVNVYVFSPDEQEIACCTCLLTPNAVSTVSARQLISKSLTPAVPTSVTVKLLATAYAGTGASCDAATPGALAIGLIAFGTNIHLAPVGGSITSSTYAMTETAFTPSTLSASELARASTLCGFSLANGSGYGICPGCTAGAAGAVRQ